MRAWSSQYSYVTHQNSVRRVLSTSLSSQDLKSVQAAVKDADRAEWQTAAYSYRHAMTPKGMTKERARDLANQFVRDELGSAQQLEAQGDRAGAMLHLGYAMHCLQDATSPAHAGFREYEGGNAELASHVWEELFDPGPGSQLDEATKQSYLYFKGTLQQPNDFFATLGHDVYRKKKR